MWQLAPGTGKAGRGKGRPKESRPAAKPPADDGPLVGAERHKKRSMLGTFWAIMLGKPAEPTKPVESGTEPSARPVENKSRAKRSWFGSFWALMLGRPSKPAKPKSKPKPVTVRTTEQKSGPSETAAATAKTGATTSVTETSTVSEVGKKKKKEKPKRKGIWASTVGSIMFVVGLLFLGVVWVVQKVREGIEWIRVKLNLD